MKMDETERDTSKIDDNWQTVTNQRLSKVPQDSKTSGVHAYFSFTANDTRSKPISRQHAPQKSTPSESLAYVERRKKRADLPPFRLEFEAQQTPMERLPPIQLVINRHTYCLSLRITHRPMKCYSRAARDLIHSVG